MKMGTVMYIKRICKFLFSIEKCLGHFIYVSRVWDNWDVPLTGSHTGHMPIAHPALSHLGPPPLAIANFVVRCFFLFEFF